MSAPRPATDDPPEEALKTYLQVHYDDVADDESGNTMMGLAYLQAPLVEIEVAGLRRLLPDTRFFKTQLATAYMEYPRVWALASFRPGAAGRDDIWD